MIKLKPNLTEQEERNAVGDIVVRAINKTINDYNKQFKFIQITGLKLNINHPAPVEAELGYQKFFKKLMFWRK